MCFAPKIDNTIQKQQLKEAEEARAREAAREARIKSGSEAVTNQFNQFDDAFYGKREQAYMGYYQPQLDDKFADARKQLTYAFARAGTLNSTAAADKNADLTKQYGTQLAAIQSKAQGEADNLRTQVQGSKSSIISQLNATGDADAASNAALASTKQMYNSVPSYNPLGDIFAGIATGIGGMYNANNQQQILNAGGLGNNYDSSKTIY